MLLDRLFRFAITLRNQFPTWMPKVSCWAAVFSLPGRPTSGRRAAERGACSLLYSAGSKTRRRSETKHESSIPLTFRFEPPILFEMLTRFNDADEGSERKGSQRQARSIGGLIG